MLLIFRRGPVLSVRRHLFSSPPRFLSTASAVGTLWENPDSASSAESLTKPQFKTLVLSQYHDGKFSNLLQNVVASPSVLLTACHNLTHTNTSTTNDDWNSPDSLTLDSVSTHFFSIQDMAEQLGNRNFDLGSCLLEMPSEGMSFSLVLPNLKLKVLMEAIRMVLEVIYDDRFATFSYGGRVGMGRHTAIRYLKNTVENPSWWFAVSFNNRKEFDSENVTKLCLIIEEKINDALFIDIIKWLIVSKVVKIELGGCYFGRGFPQESRLSSILINIYFNGFDQKMQEFRLMINKENPEFKLDDRDDNGSMFYKPLKVYAVRYLDEILVITTGSKGLTLNLKKHVVNFIEKNLGLEVDRAETSIHSAASEKISFLGMELRAVVPSVLHCPMSEKAIRAKKKYLRQKEVRLQELRNRKETNRKKLAMKLFSHVYKKLKKSNGFKFDFQIENEVREIFSNWADEVGKEFLQSIKERENWYRKLSGGDFLSLKRIRDQLPVELVDAYDKFQEQVDKYLEPMKARKELVEKERKAEEEEKRRYEERTVKDLSKLYIKVDAPLELVRNAVRMAGFTNNMGRPRPIVSLMALEDVDIIKWYAGVGRRWLDYFCCSHNFKIVKTVVSYHLRFSCILTLAEKHESTKHESIKHYTKDLRVFDIDGSEEVHFPTEREMKMMGDKNLVDPKPVDGALTMALIRLGSDEPSYHCGAHFCQRTDTIVYRIRLLQEDLNVNPLDDKTWVSGMGVIHGSFNRKCIPLCSHHISELYIGKLTLQDIDYSSILHFGCNSIT